MASKRTRSPRTARIPSARIRNTRGPRPPDHLVEALQELVRNEFAAVVLRQVLAEFNRAQELRTDAIDLRSLTGIFSERIRKGFISATAAISQAARAGVSRAVRTERSTRIPARVPEESRLNAGYLERVERSVIDAKLGAALIDALEKAKRAGAKPGVAEITKVVEAAAERAASSIKVETQTLHSEYTEKFSRAAGLSKYVWTTRLDEIVREGHAKLEGTIQLWSEPPITHQDGHHAHPGEDRNCRCTAWPWDDGTEA